MLTEISPLRVIGRSMSITQGFDIVSIPSFFETVNPMDKQGKLVGIRFVLKKLKDREK